MVVINRNYEMSSEKEFKKYDKMGRRKEQEKKVGQI
jgi:hypothetical protein